MKTVKSWKRLEIKQKVTENTEAPVLKLNTETNDKPEVVTPELPTINETDETKEVQLNLEAFINDIEDIEKGDSVPGP